MRSTIFGIVFTLVLAGTALASELVTPAVVVISGTRVFCLATNIGKKAGPVTVTIVNSDAGRVEVSSSCESVQPMRECLAATSGQLSAGADAYCTIHTSLKVRASIDVQRLTDGVIVQTFPATK